MLWWRNATLVCLIVGEVSICDTLMRMCETTSIADNSVITTDIQICATRQQKLVFTSSQQQDTTIGNEQVKPEGQIKVAVKTTRVLTQSSNWQLKASDCTVCVDVRSSGGY